MNIAILIGILITIVFVVLNWGPKERVDGTVRKEDKVTETLKELKKELNNGNTVFDKIESRARYFIANSKQPVSEENVLILVANLCNRLFIRHRIYFPEIEEDYLIDIWKVSTKKLYEKGFISKEKYTSQMNFINETVIEYRTEHKSAFKDDRDDLLNNPLNGGNWWF